MLGISYDGFLTLTSLVDPHPALKVAVPMNPMVDGWMGDDWFHNGAFRQQNMVYMYEQEGTRDNSAKWWTGHFDDYDEYMQGGSAGAIGRRHGLEQMGFWRKVLDHPAYDAFWQAQAMDRLLAAQSARRADDDRPQPVGPGRHLRRASRCTRRSSRRTPRTTSCSSSSARGTTARKSSPRRRSDRSGSAATPEPVSSGRSCARSWTITSRTMRRRPTWRR